MFNSDKPITKIEDDVLNRGNFSKQLAHAILAYTKTDNFVISLCGRWGSGKTSILNMVLDEIEKNVQPNTDDTPIIVKFNPWNYSDSSQLINQFFGVMLATLKSKCGGEKFKVLGNILEKYSSLFNYTQYIPVVGSFVAPLSESMKSVGESMKEKSEEMNSIDVQKDVVTKALLDQNHKFIVVIDDIDRLNNSQIRAIFQLINTVAGFPNMIYLLSFDREVVTRALQEEQNCNGEEYLEKIIQVPFDIPEANLDLVSNIFIEKVEKIILTEDRINDFDTGYWQSVYTNCIYPFIKGIRDVNRILNTFEFKYNLMKNEVNETDLLAITTLQICAPEIFKWIRENVITLVGGLEYIDAISGKEQKNNSLKYKEQFVNIYPKNPNLMLKILQTLFPKFAWYTGGNFYLKWEKSTELLYKNRIASLDKIDAYFDLSLESIPINQEKIRETIYSYDKNSLNKFMESILREGKLLYYLSELSARIQDIPDDRINLFIEILISIQGKDRERDLHKHLTVVPTTKCMDILMDLLDKNKKEDNSAILSHMIETSKKNDFPALARIICRIDEGYRKNDDYIDTKYQFIDQKDSDVIKQKLLDKMDDCIDNIFEINQYEDLFWSWSDLDSDRCRTHIISLMQDEINIPKLLSLCKGNWSSSDNSRGWTFNENNFSRYISSEDAYRGIMKLKNTKKFSELDYMFKQMAIAFEIWYNLPDKNVNSSHREISQAIVESKMSEWQQSI